MSSSQINACTVVLWLRSLFGWTLFMDVVHSFAAGGRLTGFLFDHSWFNRLFMSLLRVTLKSVVYLCPDLVGILCKEWLRDAFILRLGHSLVSLSALPHAKTIYILHCCTNYGIQIHTSEHPELSFHQVMSLQQWAPKKKASHYYSPLHVSG